MVAAFCPRLFREATQLKSVGAVVREAGIEGRHVEIQVHPVAAAHRRRIAEPVVADGAQRAIGSLAVARGGMLPVVYFLLLSI